MLLRVFLMVMSNHSKVFQCLRNDSFLFRWALWLLGILRFRFIVVLALNNAVFLLYLSNIETADLQTTAFQNIIRFSGIREVPPLDSE